VFMRAYEGMVFSTALRLTADRAVAEDLAQEVFLRAYERFGELAGSASAGGWLKTVATNLALNHLSRYRRRWRLFCELLEGSHADTLEPAVAALDEMTTVIGAEQRRALVERALAGAVARERHRS
jgi:RNA polymerase sigma-70 factor, ECF subfamily